MSSEQINKDKLNELLGIKDGQSFEDYLGEGTSFDTQSVIDQTAKLIEETKTAVGEVEQNFKGKIQLMDDAKREIQKCNDDSDGSASVRIDNLINVENAFKSIEDLVDSTKQMLGNVYAIISSCDVLDSETVGAAASLIGETRQLIAEYMSLFKQRIKFFDSVKMEMLKQKHRLEILEYKSRKEEEKWERQNSQPANAVEVGENGNPISNGGGIQASSYDMLKLMQEIDDEEEDDDVEQEVG